MSDLKLPVLGGGILHILQPLPPNPNERYRRDIGDEVGLLIYLKDNGHRLFDPYEFSPVEAIH
jgi:hypothetical protein